MHNDISASSITTNPPNLLASYFYGYAKRYYQANTLEKGKGYWIKTNQSGTITLTALSKQSNTIYSETVDESWPMLIFRDRKGNEQRLYLASNYEKSKYELPPIPPAGSFDIRFENDKYVEEFNSQTKNVLVTCDADELEIEARNLDFKLINQIESEDKSALIRDSEKKIIETKNLSSLKIEPIIQVKYYELMQNYPNPFNSITKISFSIPKEELVEIKLYNILGQEVKTIISKKFLNGIHSVYLDASELTSGIYIYKIQAGNFTDNKKLILIK